MRVGINYSLDSALTFSEQFEPKEQTYFISTYVHKHLFNPKKLPFTDSVLSYLEKSAPRRNNPVIINTRLRLICLYNIQQGKFDAALHYANQAYHHAITQCPDQLLENYHSKSLSHYYINQYDSAVYYWKLGYRDARILKDDYKTYLFASNLGTYYFNQDQLSLALKFFTEALESSSKDNLKEPVLTNNIIATLVSQKKLQEAYNYWEKYRDILQLDTNTYKGQLLYLSRINLLLLLDKKQEAGRLFEALRRQNIAPALKQDFARITSEKFFVFKEFNRFLDTAILSLLKPHLLLLVRNNEKLWLQHRNEYAIISLIPEIEKQYRNELLKTTEKQTSQLYSAAKLLGKHYSDAQNYIKANQFYAQSIQFKSELDSIHLELQNKQSEALNQVEAIYTEIREKERQIEKDRQIRLGLIVSIALLILIIALNIHIFKNNLRIKAIEKEKLLNEQAALEREQQLNNRIVEYSKSIISNNKQIKQQLSLLLSQVSIPVQKQIKQIQSQIEDVVALDSDENPGIAQKIIEENHDWERKYPGFESLNKTEKRVFVLTMENYKSKEIAHVLGVAVQYVRNVKSRLRKKLNLPDTW